MIVSNYATPVQVNGYVCRNCSDVELANKHIDPDHPKSGPYGINADSDPTVDSGPVTFGGSLTDIFMRGTEGSSPQEKPSRPLDISV